MRKNDYLIKNCYQSYFVVHQSTARVIFIGENHGDDAAHALELEILRELQESLDQRQQRLALSLEFYDRESQTVMNEYLKGVASLDTFLSDSKPPANHSDYQPLIDFCKGMGKKQHFFYLRILFFLSEILVII